jgi:hypothetical protein
LFLKVGCLHLAFARRLIFLGNTFIKGQNMRTPLPSNKFFYIVLCFIGFVIFIGIACSTYSRPNPTPTTTLPDFPWPPPEPSEFSTLSFEEATTLGDVNYRLLEALDARGYDDRSYYGVPNGFAIVTRIEQIDSKGFPKNTNRWVSELAPISLKEFSWDEYLEALFKAPEGHYRIFVFIVTSDLVISSGTPVSQGEAETWKLKGANKLPTDMERLPFTKDHTCTVYVYEFVQSGHGNPANQNIPSEISALQHLERAGMLEALER